MKTRHLVLVLIGSLALQSFQYDRQLSPVKPITSTPPHPLMQSLPPAFPAISDEELSTEYGREMKIAHVFASEGDYYRAITCFRRALILMPESEIDRMIDAEYGVVLSYYMAHKFEECLAAFQTSHLLQIPQETAIYRELLVILYDCYHKLDQNEVAKSLLDVLETKEPLTAHKLEIGTLIEEGNALDAAKLPYAPGYLADMISTYCEQQRNPKTAKALNAILPGAGYWYVGQKTTAMTALAVNALFTWAAYEFFHRGYYAAGIFTASLETGWYFGGIMGAGAAAVDYNNYLYKEMGEKILVREKLYPILMLNYSF
ncbi:MAG: tetratricopeptide repeat protein [Parachlamydiales bacterium]|nr:tetratricopeptide repeat protein [Parachlamydiales bacterium]